MTSPSEASIRRQQPLVVKNRSFSLRLALPAGAAVAREGSAALRPVVSTLAAKHCALFS